MSNSPGVTTKPAGTSMTVAPSTGRSLPTRAIRSPSIRMSNDAVASVRRVDDPPALKQPLHVPLHPPVDTTPPCAPRRRSRPVRESPSTDRRRRPSRSRRRGSSVPGCMMMTSGFARRIRSRVIPNTVKYSRSDGKNAPCIRSSCTRSSMTTSAPSTASSTDVVRRNAFALDAGRHQRRRPAHPHVGAELREQLHVRPQHAAVQQVADNGDLQAL